MPLVTPYTPGRQNFARILEIQLDFVGKAQFKNTVGSQAHQHRGQKHKLALWGFPSFLNHQLAEHFGPFAAAILSSGKLYRALGVILETNWGKINKQTIPVLVPVLRSFPLPAQRHRLPSHLSHDRPLRGLILSHAKLKYEIP
jgi:hypothetical protein